MKIKNVFKIVAVIMFFLILSTFISFNGKLEKTPKTTDVIKTTELIQNSSGGRMEEREVTLAIGQTYKIEGYGTFDFRAEASNNNVLIGTDYPDNYTIKATRSGKTKVCIYANHDGIVPKCCIMVTVLAPAGSDNVIYRNTSVCEGDKQTIYIANINLDNVYAYSQNNNNVEVTNYTCNNASSYIAITVKAKKKNTTTQIYVKDKTNSQLPPRAVITVKVYAKGSPNPDDDSQGGSSGGTGGGSYQYVPAPQAKVGYTDNIFLDPGESFDIPLHYIDRWDNLDWNTNLEVSYSKGGDGYVPSIHVKRVAKGDAVISLSNYGNRDWQGGYQTWNVGDRTTILTGIIGNPTTITPIKEVTEVKVSQIVVSNPSSGVYKEGKNILFIIPCNQNVYGSKDREELSIKTAPELKLQFGEGKEKNATFSGVNGNIMMYEYKISKEDNGKLRAISLDSGQVYNYYGTKTVFDMKEPELTRADIIADTQGPSITITGKPTKWTNKDVPLNIRVEDNFSDVENSVYVNGTKIDLVRGVGSYKAPTNSIYTVTAKDKLGNQTKKSIFIDKIDKDLPTVEVIGKSSKWTNKDVRLTIEATDTESGVNSIKLSDSNNSEIKPDEKDGKYVISQNGTYTIKVKDNAGNEKTQIEKITNTDKTLPIIEKIEKTPNEKTKDDVTVQIKTKDNESGISYVIVSGEKKEPDDNGVVEYKINKNGKYKIIVVDNAGNRYDKEYVTVDNIDTTVEPEDKEGPKINVEGNSKNWTNQDIILTLEAVDDSEVKSVTVNETAVTLTNGEGTYTVSENGTYTIEAIDTLGNKTTKIEEVNKIDKTLPTVKITKDKETWTNEDVILTIEAKDEQSGIEYVNVKGVKQNLDSQGKVKYTVTKNDTYKIVLVDNAGNVRSQEIKIENIDKKSPTLDIEVNEERTSMKIKTKDDLSGINTVTVDGHLVNLVNGEADYNITQNMTYKVVVVDNAKNTAQKNVEITKKLVLGNINEDNNIDIKDVLQLRRYISYMSSKTIQNKHKDWNLTEDQKKGADVNEDGNINIQDVLALRRYIAAKSNKQIFIKHPDWIW